MLTKIVLSAAVAGAVMTGSMAWAANPMSESDCNALFTKNDVNNDGSLGDKEAEAYLLKMPPAGDGTKKDAAGIIQKDAFMSECVKGTFNP